MQRIFIQEAIMKEGAEVLIKGGRGIDYQLTIV